MITVEQKMKEFQAKSYEERLKISMNIIVNLKDRGNAQAQYIYDKISNVSRIPDNVINAIYKDFCDTVENIQQERIQGELHSFSTAKDYIKKLREKEEKERQEENCDSLLDGIDDL